MNPENGYVNNNSIWLEIILFSEKSVGLDANDMPMAKRAKLDSTNETKSLQIECAVCSYCVDNQNLACTPCGHLFCFECITKAINDHTVCPTCAEPVQLNNLRRLYLPV